MDGVGIVEWAAEKLGFEPDGWQRDVLESGARQGILNCARQTGKSTVAAVKAVWEAVTRAGSVVVAAAPTEKQSGELVRKARGMLRELGVKARADGVHRGGLALPNGSRIIGVPGDEDTVRGISAVSLLIVDEASRVTDGLYRALRPMLATSSNAHNGVARRKSADWAFDPGGARPPVRSDSNAHNGVAGQRADGELDSCGPQPAVRLGGGGAVWLLSTPRGKSGFFWEAWEFGGEEWARFTGRATECPRISAEWLERERTEMGEAAFRTEYLCEFGEDEGAVFDREVVLGAWEE